MCCPPSVAAGSPPHWWPSCTKAYNAVGGHAAIASNLLEDVALARAVKRSGRKIFFRYGDDAVRTRMYRSFAHLREGWTKNLALLFPSPVRLAALRSIEFVLIVSSFASAMANIARSHWTPAILSATLAVILYALFLQRVRRAHFYWDANILALFGLPLFSYLLLRSALSYRRGKVTWKGRNYSGKGTGAEQLPPEPGDKLSPALQPKDSSISNSVPKPSAAEKGVVLRTGN
jgi:hypothetical protein